VGDYCRSVASEITKKEIQLLRGTRPGGSSERQRGTRWNWTRWTGKDTTWNGTRKGGVKVLRDFPELLERTTAY